MCKIKSIVLVTLLVLTLMPATIPMIPTASAATLPYTEENGTLNGANYTLRIPNPLNNWNRVLVVFCRGYGHTLPTGPLISQTIGSSTWATVCLADGIAFAISSYGSGGYCIEKGMNSTYEMTQYIVSTYKVAKVYLLGFSMGGNIALMLADKYPEVYSGVLDMSGYKNIAQEYRYRIDLAATANDTELIEKIHALNGTVPPFPISVVVPPPTSNQLRVFRALCNESAADIAAECGGTPDEVPLAYQNIDPIYHADISIPVISVHGTNDAMMPYSYALTYQAAVAAAGKSSLYRLYTVVGGEHVDAAVQTEAGNHVSELMMMSEQLRPMLQASAFCNVTVLTGWTWWFFAQSIGGTDSRTCQWYEGTTPLQGQTSMVLVVTKNTPGTYTYYCRVTDSEGVTIDTNTIALTVR